jgi:hypothetical protein
LFAGILSLSIFKERFSGCLLLNINSAILLTAASDKVYQLLAHGRWFSPGTPASSTTKTDRHDIAEKLLS